MARSITSINTGRMRGRQKRSLDLHGSPGYGGTQQTFNTIKGQRHPGFVLACRLR